MLLHHRPISVHPGRALLLFAVLGTLTAAAPTLPNLHNEPMIRLVTTVLVADEPSLVAINSRTHRVYVAVGQHGVVQLLDGATDALLGSLDVGRPTSALGVDPTANRLYVASVDGTVSLFDATDLTPLGEVRVGPVPIGLATDSVSGLVYTTHAGSAFVSLFDGLGGGAAGALPLGNPAFGIAVHPVTQRVTVTLPARNAILILDEQSGAPLAEIPVGAFPIAIDIDTTANRIVVANYLDQTVSILDSLSHALLATVAVGSHPRSLAVNPRTHRVFVANIQDGTVSVFDDLRPGNVTTVPVGVYPSSVAVDAATGRVYVAAQGGNALLVLQDQP